MFDLSENPVPSIMQREYVAVPAIDLGATHLRIAFVLRNIRTGMILDDIEKSIIWEFKMSMEEIEKKHGGSVDDMIKLIAALIKREGMREAETRGIAVLRHVGIGSLGGYYDDGRMYPGTAPKRKALEKINLSFEIERAMGDGWKASIENDGMVQALISAEAFLNSPDRKKVPVRAINKGKIMVIVPGTSIGGGGVLIEPDGYNVRPMPGPHQIWDIVLRELTEDEVFLKRTEEDDHSSLKRAREAGMFLSLDIGGTYLDVKAGRLGFSGGEQMGDALLGVMEPGKREQSEAIYRRSARDLVTTIKKMYQGKGEKAVVIGSDEMKEFWDNTKGTEIFILGGWLTANHVIKDIVFREVEEGLAEAGLENIVIAAQSDIPGIGGLIPKAGVLGASLLVPEEELRNISGKDDTEHLLGGKIVAEMRSILRTGGGIDKVSEKMGIFLSSLAKDPSFGTKVIPVLYGSAQKELDEDEVDILSRSTFKIFTGVTVAAYAEKYSKITLPQEIQKEDGPRIVTLTPNPALDFAADCDTLFLGDKRSREEAFKLDAGGKGLNVSVGLHKWGVETIPMGFIGGATGKIMRGILNDMGISTCYLTGIAQNTRINPSIHSRQKGQVHLENAGPVISPEEQKNLERTLLNILREGDHLLMAGRLPRGVGERYYAEWIEKAKKKGVKTYIDTRNVRVLGYAIKAEPDFLGVNINELAGYLGVNVEELEQSYEKIAVFGRSLVEKGIKEVVISMGARGMIMSSKDGNWLAQPPKIEKISSVGAGDTIKLAFVYADKNGMTGLEALRLATAASALSVTKAGTELAGLKESLDKMEEVVIKRVIENKNW